jgi:hypothetical protein
LLFVEMRRSIAGCARAKASRRGSSQPVAKVPTTPTFSASRKAAVGILVERRGDAVERVGEHGDERMAFVGEREAARQAVEEARAEAAFELRDLMADRALADAQLDRGAGEIEMARRGLEGAKGVEGELGAIHGAS